MKGRSRAVTLVSLALIQGGCGAGWHRVSLDDPRLIRPKQQVLVWSTAQRQQWHGLQFSADTLKGIPYFQPLTCDTCRRAVAREDIDSLQAGNPVAGFWRSVGLGTGLLLGLGLVACATEKVCTLGND